MHYREFLPSASLAALVESYWHLRCAGSGSWEPIYPDACTEILFNLGEPAEELERQRRSRQPRYLVYGQIEERILVRSAVDTEVLAIRLRPWGASALLQLPADLLTGQAVELDATTPLASRLIFIAEDDAPAATKVERLDACLAWWARREGIETPPTCGVARHLQVTPGASASDVARLTGWTTRTLQRRFRGEIGLTVRRFRQITRFLRYLRWLDLEPETPISQLAIAAGYYDQPHLHRDLRRFTGDTPAVFRARRAGTFDRLYGRERLDRLVAI